MKSIRFLLLLLALAATLLLAVGCSKHYVDVYINDKCLLVTLENDEIIDPLVVFPGDYVIFNNLTDEEVVMNLPDDMFSKDDVTIPAGKRVILKVIQKDPVTKEISIDCDGGSSLPKVRVGEDP